MAVTCYEPTAHFATGRQLLLYYDSNGDGILSKEETEQVVHDYNAGKRTWDEVSFVSSCYSDYAGVIDDMCPPPAAETPTKLIIRPDTWLLEPEDTVNVIGELLAGSTPLPDTWLDIIIDGTLHLAFVKTDADGKYTFESTSYVEGIHSYCLFYAGEAGTYAPCSSGCITIEWKGAGFWGPVKDFVSSWFPIVTKSASGLVDWFASAATTKWGILLKTWSDVTDAIDGAIDALSDIVDHTWKDVTDAIDGAIDALSDIVDHTWKDVTDAIDGAIDNLEDWTKQTFSDAVDDFISGFQDKFAASEDKAVAFLTALGIGAGDVITTILDTPADMVQWLKAELKSTWDVLEHTWSDVTDAIDGAIDALSDIVDHTWKDVTDAIDGAIDALSDIVDHTWSEVTGAIDAAIAGLSDIVDHTWKEVTEAISGAEDAVKEWFGEQGDMVRSMVHSGFNTLDDWMDAQISKVKEWIHAGYDTLDDWMDDQGSKVKSWIHSGFDTLDDWMDSQKDKVYGWISDKWVDKILDLIDAKVEHYKDKIWEIVEKVVEKL